MAFIYEQVPEQDREFLESMGLKNCWGSEPQCFSKYADWTADRERNAYLVGAGGGMHDVPLTYDLWWNGSVVRMEYDECGTTGNAAVGYHIVWSIQEIAITDELWEKRDQVVQLIREGLSINPAGMTRGEIKSITVNIECEPTKADPKKGSGCYVSRN